MTFLKKYLNLLDIFGRGGCIFYVMITPQKNRSTNVLIISDQKTLRTKLRTLLAQISADSLRKGVGKNNS